MGLDLFTLLVMAQLVSIVCGLLFLVEAIHGRSRPSWYFAWAFLCAPLSALFYIAAGSNLNFLQGYPIGNGVAIVTVALTWCGARQLNERRPFLPLALAVALLVTVTVLLFEKNVGPWNGAYPFFAAFAAFNLAAALEFWRGRTGERRPRNALVLAGISGFNAFLYLSRAGGLWLLGPDHPLFTTFLGPEISTAILTVLIVVFSFTLIALGKERADAQLRHAATHDELTGLMNRREFMRLAEEMLAGLASDDGLAAVLLMDIDHFKKVNDTHGHGVGDRVLALFASTARDTLGGKGVLCRYGGEEFAVVLPGMTREEGVAQAERLRIAFSDATAITSMAVHPTVSIGVVSAPASLLLSALLERADKQLYLAKASGRNRTVADVDLPDALRRSNAPMRLFGERGGTALSA